MNLAALKHLNPEQVEVGIDLVQLPKEIEGLESERSGNVELCWQEE